MKHRNALAAMAGIAVLAAVPATGMAGSTQTEQPPPQNCQPYDTQCQNPLKGRMTGHGHFVDAALGGKVQWEFRNSVCRAERFPDLKVEFGDGRRFVLKSYTRPLTCIDTDADEEQPRAGFDTIVGQGTGLLDGEPASAWFRFTDNGEPGRNDLASITIRQGGVPVLQFANRTAGAGGNHQAHRSNR